MFQATWKKYQLHFKQPGGTSRGVLHSKNSWIIELTDDSNPKAKGVGEASIIENLSPDWNSDYENKIEDVCKNIHPIIENDLRDLTDYPSIRFAVESALLQLIQGQHYFPSAFTEGKACITINGLVWMGSREFMEKQIDEKLKDGYACIKLKIGALDFETELEILRNIRLRYTEKEIELRVDANGAFKKEEALAKLDLLAKFKLHSIEQPIKAGQINEMTSLCKQTPLPIALDEELIGINQIKQKENLIHEIKPQYIILKPSLVGGFQSSDEWISIAEKNNSGWWITSALESNIGLDAIAQYTYIKNV
ncbi:MAG: o-succinylbenzoate synthase, partial [Crocinitomicaceae bacterium]|nr:o-succinylbenzoate synthase [Crocinitomicaceae bacterium]